MRKWTKILPLFVVEWIVKTQIAPTVTHHHGVKKMVWTGPPGVEFVEYDRHGDEGSDG